jgi:micrococcal nuclease
MRTVSTRALFSRSGLILLVLFVIVTIVSGAPYFIAGPDAQRPPVEETRTALQLPPGVSLTDLQSVTVSEVIDGDTADVLINGKPVRIRYFGVDTPEAGDRCFREATDRNRTLVGKRVLLLPDSRELDGFGRTLRYVFLEDGTSVDATLVAEGLGKAWRQDGRYRDQIVSIEAEAQAAGRGCLWR